MTIIPAEGALLDQIFDLTYPIWNEGLSREAYARWNTTQMRTPWGRDRLQRFALVNAAGSLLATAKRYRFDVRVNGRSGWMCGFGAVFTPPDRRGQGHAAALIEQLLAKEKADGALLAALFSEIGSTFYERLGFSVVPLNEVTVQVRLKGGAPAMLVRAGHESDIPAIAAMHDVRAGSVPFALRRDPSMIGYALAKKRLFAGLSPAGARQLEFFVAEEGASAVAYVVLSINPHGWTIEEAGDRDPAGARLGAMLQVLIAREPAARPPLVRAWWPHAFPVPPQLQLTDRTDARDIFMLRPLSDVVMPTRTEDVFYWRSDYF